MRRASTSPVSSTPSYIVEWWANAFEDWQAAAIELPSDDDARRADAQLDLAGALSGRLLGPGGSPVDGVAVDAYRYAADWSSYDLEGSAVSAVDGTFSVGSLPAGDYAVRFRDPDGDYVTEYFAGQRRQEDANIVSVSVGTTTAMGEHTLTNAGRIAGTVRGSVGGLEYVHVVASLFDSDGGYWAYFDETTADATGAYELAGLSAGSYVIEFWDEAGNYFWQTTTVSR